MIDTQSSQIGQGLSSNAPAASTTRKEPTVKGHHASNRKRPFIDAFTVAFDETRSPEVPERHYQFFDKYVSPLKQSPRNHNNAESVYNTSGNYVTEDLEEIDSTSEKFTALVQTTGACIVAGADLFSSVLVQATKSIYSFVNNTYQENVQQNKRRRINSDASAITRPQFLKDRPAVPVDKLFPDQTQFSSSRPIDARNLVASPVSKIPGSFHWTQDTPTAKKPPRTEKQLLSSEPAGQSLYAKRQLNLSSEGLFTPLHKRILQNPQFSSLPPGSPMDIDTPFDLETPKKQVYSGIGVEPKTFKPAVTPSFDPRALSHRIVPNSPLASSETNVKVRQLFEGLRRHRQGILNHAASSPKHHTGPNTPPLTRLGSVHGGGNILSSLESPSKYRHDSVLNSPGIMRAFRFDERRLAGRRPLPYAASWYYTPPQIELPEQAPSTEIYAKAYMDLVAQREKLAKDVEQLRKTEEEEKAKKLAKDEVKLLDPKSVKMVENLWKRRDESTELVLAYRIGISVYDLRTLRDGQWLNDNVIDFYLSMVSERSKESNGQLPTCFAFSTHFFSTLQTRGYSGVARWAKRKGIDVTKQDFIFVPINRHNTHWCLAVINNRDMRFEFYDSMNGAGTAALDLLCDYMYQQTASTYPDSNQEEMGYDKYEICSTLECPQQQNSFDCGVFVSKMVDVLSRDRDIMSFSQKDMPNIRRRMAFEITEKQLLP